MNTAITPPVIDAHAHIFQRSLAMANDKRYTPDRDAVVSEYLNELDKNCFTHGVLVQPSFLGFNNDYLLAALNAHPDRLRGVAVVDPAIGPNELAALSAQGVTGIRLNLFGRGMPNFQKAPWPAFQEKLQKLGLHVEIHCESHHLEKVLPSFLNAGNRLVVDHFGRPDAALGTGDPGFQYLLEAGATGQVWVKLTAAYRLGKEPEAPFAGPDVIAGLINSISLERLVWGSDWPHTQFTNRMDFKSALQLFENLVPDVKTKQQILSGSAKVLFNI